MNRSDAGSKHKTAELIREVTGLARSKKFNVKTLGYLDGYPLLLCQRIGSYHSKKTRLAAALFHGDEIASTMGIVKFLKTTSSSELDHLDLTLLPVVNPTGHSLGTRENIWGQDPNRGYNGKKQDLPKEGAILLSHHKELVKSSQHGFLSLHEDSDIKEGAFAYCYSQQPEGVQLAKDLLSIAHGHVGTVTNKTLLKLNKDNQGTVHSSHPGIVLDDSMESFDDWMYGQQVTPVIVTETPSKDNDLNKRIDANWKMLRVFCELSA